MANRDFKKIERIMKDFSLNIGEGSGGTIKVTELPEVGEEHTIYELEEKKYVDGTYNYVLEYDSKYGIGTINAKVVETSADLPIEMDSNMYYVRTEDKLGFANAKAGDFIWFDHLQDKDSNDIVGAFSNSDTYIICKEVISVEGTNYTVKLLDDTTYTYIAPEIAPFISKLVEVQKAEIMDSVGGFPTIVINNESELPTYQEAIDEGLVNENGFLLYGYATLQGDAWYLGSLNDIEQTINWDVSEKLDVENEVNFNEPGVLMHNYLFVRQNGGDITKTSYWVYSNNEWFNVDELSPGTGGLKLGINSYGVDASPRGQKELPLDWLKFEICTNYGGEEELEWEELPIITYAVYEPEIEITYNGFHCYLGYISGYPMPTGDNRKQYIRISFVGDEGSGLNPFTGGDFFIKINNVIDWRIGDNEPCMFDLEGLTSITLQVTQFPF